MFNNFLNILSGAPDYPPIPRRIFFLVGKKCNLSARGRLDEFTQSFSCYQRSITVKNYTNRIFPKKRDCLLNRMCGTELVFLAYEIYLFLGVNAAFNFLRLITNNY